MVKPYLEEVGGKAENDVSLFTGGINTYQDKAFIEDDQLSYSMNMTMYKPPMLCTRASREHITNIDLTTNKNIVAMWAYNDNWCLMIARPETTGNARIFWRYEENGTEYGDYLTNELPWANAYHICYCRQETNEYLYITTDTVKLKLTIDSTGVLNEEKIEDGHYGRTAFHKGRLFFANPTTNRITYSALWDFDNFLEIPDMSSYETIITQDVVLSDGTTPTPPDVPSETGTYNTGGYQIVLNARQIAKNDTTFYYDKDELSITFESGDKLVYREVEPNTYVWQKTMLDFSSYSGEFFVTNSKGSVTNIASFDDKLVIFCEHSMHVMYGSTPLVGSQYQFQLVDLNNNLGCIAPKSIAIGGGNLFWLGDDNEVYKYTGSSIDMISRPNGSRYVQRKGAISNIPLIPEQWSIGYDSYPSVCATATSDKYYITMPINYYPITDEKIATAYPVFAYDVYNQIWWAEDGALTAICNISFGRNNVLMARDKEVFSTTDNYTGVDHIFNKENQLEDIPIEYEFHTKVFGAIESSSRKTISKVHFQAVAEANIYLTDSWTASDYWTGPFLDNSLKQIGKLEKKYRDVETRGSTPYNDVYEDNLYEQQVCFVEKMYGQRLNTFQIVIKGVGTSKFFLMKREWRLS